MKKLIEESGLTKKEFAELYNIPYNTVLQWYNGVRQAPKYLIKLIKENKELKTKDVQLEIELDEFKYYEKIIDSMEEDYYIKKRIEIWGKKSFVQIQRSEYGITIEYGKHGNYTSRNLFGESDLRKIIKENLK